MGVGGSGGCTRARERAGAQPSPPHSAVSAVSEPTVDGSALKRLLLTMLRGGEGCERGVVLVVGAPTAPRPAARRRGGAHSVERDARLPMESGRGPTKELESRSTRVRPTRLPMESGTAPPRLLKLSSLRLGECARVRAR